MRPPMRLMQLLQPPRELRDLQSQAQYEATLIYIGYVNLIFILYQSTYIIYLLTKAMSLHQVAPGPLAIMITRRKKS